VLGAGEIVLTMRCGIWYTLCLMSREMLDIEWLDHIDDAFAEARRRNRLVVVKPAGQGIGIKDDW